ncbi:MAG: hypothetical protein LC745_01490 [Planctomycetia bacterium]|nr:hypothetical protein [Planctomycetia bacterium]
MIDFQKQREFALALAVALGLDPRRARGFTLRVGVDSVATVEVEMYLSDEQTGALTGLLGTRTLTVSPA